MDPSKANLLQQAFLDQIAQSLDRMITAYYGECMGFSLLVFPMGVPEEEATSGNYVSNADRSDMIKALRDIASQIESGEIIPKTIGNA